MRQFEYESRFGVYISGLIDVKHSNGFGYDVEAWHLWKFDQFCRQRYPEASVVTKEIADDWCTRRDTESGSYHSRRISVLRQLCLYMSALGISVYVPKDLTSREKPILTIPSKSEMSEFFQVLDSRKSDRRTYRFMYAYRIMFRLYYCCGMRLSEVRKLMRDDIDLNKMVITVRRSKGQKDRLVYLPEDSFDMISEYFHFISTLIPVSPFLFPGQSALSPITGAAVERMFRICWGETTASRKYDKSPTVHCLRHAFVVERINLWAAEGIEFDEMLPYLSKYLGHASPLETHYYYHLVESAFATIQKKGTSTTTVIPEVRSIEE